MTIAGISAIASYRREWLPKDIVAGIVLAGLLVPSGMAYAELAGLPPITGLYTTILCLLGYAVFGPSRVLVLGPDSALGPMIAATILPLMLAGSDPARAVALASVLALMVGAFMVIGALARLGFIADLLSKPTQIGYMNGLALTIVIGQLPKLFGFKVDANGLAAEALGFAQAVANGDTVPASLAIGGAALVLMLVLQQWLPKVPAVLVAVVGSMVVAYVFDAAARGVSLVGPLPSGLPAFTVPIVRVTDVPILLAGAIGIAVVSLADTISTSSAFAARTGQDVKANQEMIGLGAANIGAAFFQGFPVSTSGSRTAVAERAGAKSQLTGVVGAALIMAMLVFVPGLLQYLPQPTLAAVVIVASISLADLPATLRLWRSRRAEFWLSMAAFLGVAFLGVLPGIVIAIGLSILDVFRRVWSPYRTELGRIDGLPGYHDVNEYPAAEQLPGLVMFRFDGQLIFANAKTFREEIHDLVRSVPKPVWIVIAAEPITDVDTTAGGIIEELYDDLTAEGVSLVFAELKDVVRNRIERYELRWPMDPTHFYPTVGAAVAEFRKQSDAAWGPRPDSPENADDAS